MKPRLALTAIIIVLALGGLIALRWVVGRPSSANNERSTQTRASSSNAPTASRLPRESLGQVNARPRPFEIKREYVNKIDPSTSAPVFAVDPENQPRAFASMDFRNLDAPPPGYKLENVILTPEGFTLPPPEPGKENQPRMGIVESAPHMFDFFSNAVAPLWKENLPDGTDMFVEMSVSPDGVHWGPWQWVEIDEDSAGQISPFYPDGRPNPNYGYTPGTMLAWGLTQWGYVRYRVRLYSEGPASPVLSEFRLFYQDSTLGEGQVATPETMQVEEVSTALGTENQEQEVRSQ